MRNRLKNIFLITIGLSLLLIWPAKKIHAASPIWATTSLAILIEEGLDNNKEIQSLKFRVESLNERVAYAGSLTDPKIGIGLLNLPVDSLKFDQEPMTQKQLFISQKFPWFGKLNLNSQQAGLIVIRQEYILAAKQLELARKIATAYYDLGFIGFSLKINAKLTDMLNQTLQVAETRYATGQGIQQDIFQAQVELSKLQNEKIILEKKHLIAQDMINALLNRESFSSIKFTDEVKYPDLNLIIPDLQSMVLEQNPLIKVKAAEADKTKVEIELARKDYYPDMDFKIAYGQREEDMTGRDRDDFVSASVMMNIPLWQKNRQNRKLAASKAGEQAAMKSLKGLTESLPYKVEALSAEIIQAQKSYRLYADTLISQTRQWAGSSLAAYEVGKVEFNTMINARIRVLRFELQGKKYLYEIYKKRAELEEVLGGPLPAKIDMGSNKKRN